MLRPDKLIGHLARRRRPCVEHLPAPTLAWLTILAAILVATTIVNAASSATAVLSNGRNNLSDEERERARVGAFRLGMRPDPFVAASPLIVAAVCSDGVAMVAAHTVSVKEPLLSDVINKNNNQDAKENVDPTEDTEETADGPPETQHQYTTTRQQSYHRIFRDIPVGYGGPFRIHKLDGHGSVLLPAGWRADCETFSGKCRAIAAREMARFGSPPRGLNHGRFLATEASYWMAQCAGSESMRALSCVALLVGCNGGDEEQGGSLWLVDATGAYRVRALACGGGKVEGVKDEQRMVAHLVNKELQETEFDKMTVQEGVSHILRILTRESMDQEAQPLVPAESEIEIAVTDSQRQQLRRIRLSSLNPHARGR